MGKRLYLLVRKGSSRMCPSLSSLINKISPTYYFAELYFNRVGRWGSRVVNDNFRLQGFLSCRYQCHWLAITAIVVDIFGMENVKKSPPPPKKTHPKTQILPSPLKCKYNQRDLLVIPNAFKVFYCCHTTSVIDCKSSKYKCNFSEYLLAEEL